MAKPQDVSIWLLIGQVLFSGMVNAWIMLFGILIGRIVVWHLTGHELFANQIRQYEASQDVHDDRPVAMVEVISLDDVIPINGKTFQFDGKSWPKKFEYASTVFEFDGIVPAPTEPGIYTLLEGQLLYKSLIKKA